MYGFFQGQRMELYDGANHIFESKWLSRTNLHPFCRQRRDVGEFASLLHFCRVRRPKLIALKRTYALGDILMLMPLLRQFRLLVELEQPILLITTPRFVKALGDLNQTQDFVQFIKPRMIRQDYGVDVHMDLDSCLERDHRGGEESHLSRLQLYGKVLGVEVVNGEL